MSSAPELMDTLAAMAAPSRPPIKFSTKLSQMIKADSIYAEFDIGTTNLIAVSDRICNLSGPSNITTKRQVRMATPTLTVLHSKMEDATRNLSKLRSHQDLVRSKMRAIKNKIIMEKAAASTFNKEKILHHTLSGVRKSLNHPNRQPLLLEHK